YPIDKILSVQKASQFSGTAWEFELAQGFGLDLADALAGDVELLADLFQRMVGVHADAKTHTQDSLFPRGERGQHAGRGLAQVRVDGGIERQDRVFVLDEIAER